MIPPPPENVHDPAIMDIPTCPMSCNAYTVFNNPVHVPHSVSQERPGWDRALVEVKPYLRKGGSSWAKQINAIVNQ